MKNISFFYKDFGSVSSAVAQRGKYFTDAVLKHPSANDAKLLIYCVNHSVEQKHSGTEVRRVKSLKKDNKSGFFLRAIDELLTGISIGFSSFLRKSDLFVISTPPYLSGLIIAFFQIIFRRRFALDIRDMYPRTYLDAGIITENGIIHRFLNAVNRFIFKRAAFIVCATQGQKLEIFNFTNRPDVSVVYNGFPSSLLQIKKNKTEGFHVVTHGTLGTYQNVEFILELSKNLENDGVEFLIIGKGSKSKIVEAFDSKNIQFLGELPFDQIVEHLASSDVGLCVRDNSPQSRYSFPVKAWEYIGLKMPMLIYPICEVSDVFPDIEGVHTFNNLDIKKFRNIILTLKKQKEILGVSPNLQDVKKINTFTREALAGKFAEIVFRHLK